MTRHIYAVGQRVTFDTRIGTYLKRTGVFAIVKLLPPMGAELQYRVKSADEAYERVASEHELQPIGKTVIVADPHSSPVETDAARIFTRLS